jgi:hypothetical protein
VAIFFASAYVTTGDFRRLQRCGGLSNLPDHTLRESGWPSTVRGMAV